MSTTREKFATQVDKDVLSAIRQIAKEEGRQLQFIVEDALKAHIEQRGQAKPRPHVMAAYRSTIPAYASLYTKLAE